MTHGTVTSHASQGKTFEKVIVAESSESFGAASREQFYVSVSRGKHQAKIFTDDKSALREAVTRSAPRLAATELVATSGSSMTTLRRAVARALRAEERDRRPTIETPEVAGYER